METIPYAHHVLQIVRQPQEGLTTLPAAQALLEALQRIRIPGKMFDHGQEYYVTCDIPGASGDVLKAIRPATPEEWLELCRSGEVDRYRTAQQNHAQQAREKELADLIQWADRNRTRIHALPHPIDALGIRGKTLAYCLEGIDRYGLTAKLNAYRLVKSTVETTRTP